MISGGCTCSGSKSHSVDSLFARNEQLYEFASEHGLDSYDGMDVGPVEIPEAHNG